MNFGKSLCTLCEKELAGPTVIAHPSDCPTHHFHATCLIKHGRQHRQCPIDDIPFDRIVSQDGVPVQFTTSASGRTPQERAAPTGGVEKRHGTPERRQENVDGLPSAAMQVISREEEDKKAAKTGDNPGGINCGICKRNAPGEIASPDCCEHWFHQHCFEDHILKSTVCPVRGCHREITTYICGDGAFKGCAMYSQLEYRIMASAPDGFECGVCHLAELGRHRAVAKPCGHLFHRHCITDFVRNHKKCPTCETPTTLVVCDISGDLRFD